MRIHRGIVCEKNSKYTVFLTNQGDFLRGIPIGAMPEIGEEAEFHLISTGTSSLQKGKLRFIGAALVAALFFLFIVASMISPNDEVMAYVQLETDTALELGVNGEGEVISLRYLDETSDTLAKWGKKSPPIREVLDRLAKEVSPKLDEKQIIATTILVNQQNGHQANEIIGSALHDMQNIHKDLKWEVVESTVEERDRANQKQMSIQKYKQTEQAPPLKEKKSSKEMGPPEKSGLVPHQQQTESPNPENDSTVPKNGKFHGKEKQQKPIERIENNSEKAVTIPKSSGNSGEGEKGIQPPTTKEKPRNPASEKKNEGKKRPNPASEMKKESKSFSNPQKEKPNTPATSKHQGNSGS
ncbi:hypothetical protein MKY41_14810 [Sporosarcina sp. FSL W7-1349]|uniref:anti-sigma factor domain-containing protein n=1 Tax=Sporosarcina sp. FSL W7-1349 TaxID=2921561 RepID=UPI0030F570FE